RWVTADDLRRGGGEPLDQVGSVPQAVIEPRATLSDALNELVAARYAVTIVVDEHGRYQGVVDIDQVNESIRTMRSSAVAEARSHFTSTPSACTASVQTDSPGVDPSETSSCVRLQLSTGPMREWSPRPPPLRIDGRGWGISRFLWSSGSSASGSSSMCRAG